MQNNINNNEQDVFSEVFRQKLENHQLPVDAECWDEIEARLKSKKRRIIPFWFWLTGGAAVAGLALLFTLSSPSESTGLIGRSKPANTQQKQILTKRIAKHQAQQLTSVEKVPAKNATNQQPSENKKETSIAEKEFAQIQAASNDTAGSNKIIENTITKQTSTQEDLAQTHTRIKDSVSSNISTKVLPDKLVAKSTDEPVAKPKNKQNWLLAAAFGTGGGMGSNGINGELAFSPSNSYLTNAKADYSNMLTQNDFSQKNYMAPISFGLIIRKSLDKTISIETGLVYTYLLSTFENSGMQQNDAKLHLHYIGIPLNLVGRLWENSKWELYLSAGTMIEKGIQSVYVQNQYAGNQVITTIAKTNINGFQWSINGAVGVTYKVQRNWGIYFEPKLSYFFDNNQPVSARTENPVVIGVTAGVRFRIK